MDEGEGVEALPDRLDEWVDRRAAELGTDRAGVLARAVAVLRTVEADADADADVDAEADADPRRLEERVSELEADVDAKIDDVRERVIQVKREADAKADADHDHPDLRATAADARTAAGEAYDRAETAGEAAADVDDRVTAGFENFEEVLSHLRDATDENAAKLDTLARVHLDLRERVADLERDAARDEAVADIRAEANRRGITVAECESCDATVSLGLLDEPACPDCGVTFDGLGPDPGFLRKPVLTAGDPPALRAPPDAGGAETPADLFDRGAADGGTESEAAGAATDPFGTGAADAADAADEGVEDGR